MSEGARKGKTFIVICTSPDVCLTPVGPFIVPVPYQIVAKIDEACMASDNVTFAGEPAVVVTNTMVMKVIGNEAGIGGGIKSGHNRWVVEFDDGSSSVHINGRKVVRHGDSCWMNGRNTRGKVICTDGMGPACSISKGKPVTEISSNSQVDVAALGASNVAIKGTPPPPKLVPTPQAAALRRAAVKGAPFCDT